MDGDFLFHDSRPARPVACRIAVPAHRPTLVRLIDRVMGAIARARSRRVLRLLDDRMLRDIGLDRGTAQYEIDKPIWRG